jgi:hypothetical protein
LWWNKGCASGEMLLEKILEEDSSFLDESRHSGSLHSDRHHLILSSPRHHQQQQQHQHQQHHHHNNHQGHHYVTSVQVTNI